MQRKYLTAVLFIFTVSGSPPTRGSAAWRAFSREFHALLNRHLTGDGLFVQWIQLYEVENGGLSLMQGDRDGSFRFWSGYSPILFGTGQPDLFFRMLTAESTEPNR